MSEPEGTIARLRQHDEALKPERLDRECIELHDYYEDHSRELTRSFNATLQSGLEKAAQRPLEIALLRRIVDRLTVYSAPPSRFLRRDDEEGARLEDDAPELRALSRVYGRARVDSNMLRSDRLRVLYKQVALRVYPSDPDRSVSLRTFEPYNLIRRPNLAMGAAHRIETDHEFALCLAGGGDGGGLWEHWTRDAGGRWIVRVVDDGSIPVSEQPFAATDFVSPYPQLPVQVLYDEEPQGRPWLSPRCSRATWASAINAMVNDLWALVYSQAHDNVVFKLSDTNTAPTETGPSAAWAVNRDEDVLRLSGNPKIEGAIRVLLELLATWCISEDLPAGEFDRSKSVVTGVALMVQERGLNLRRKELVPLAADDERRLYAAIAGVHNVHRVAWRLPALEPAVELVWGAGELRPPRDPKELTEQLAKEVALGTKSLVDLVQRLENVDRETAIAMLEQAKRDLERWPPRSNPGAQQGDGPQLAGVDNTQDAPEESAGASLGDEPTDSSPSVVQAAQRRPRPAPAQA